MRQFVAFSQVLLLPMCLGIGQVSVHAQSSPSITPPPKAADPFFLTRAKNLARQAAERQNGGLRLYRAEAAMYGPAIDAPSRQNSDGSVTFTFKGGAPGFVTPTVETIATVTPQGQVSLQYNGPLRSAALAQVKPTPSQTQIPTQPPTTLTNSLEKPVLIPSSQPLLPKSPPSLTPTLQPKAPQTRLPTSELPPLQPAPTITPTQPLPPLATQPTPAITPQSTPSRPAQTSSTSLPNNSIAADFFLSRAKNLARQAAINANGGLAQYRPEPSMFGPAAGTPHQKNPDGSITFRFQGGAPGYRNPTTESVVTVTQNSIVTVTYNGPIRP
ncbi:hypothetical protein [Acaryochloris sp. CCMEE 5410]|uniref:hypothetical protein n=1 Tax=Acaryochloris sp. CCMEE 5410 TaxID=310037 RepID=UPI00024839F6|nr:hypothetical protein [Acaryochloris sp. CCMEE 5410]KAI9134625.1 hypothetical protein ON05_015985 [Acaryochloris sp. CCMEE 5410]